MNTNQDKLDKVYKKDGEGQLYAIQQTAFRGQIMDYPCGFPDVKNVLGNIDSFTPREDDVFLITYPKSGTHWLMEILNLLMRGKLEYQTTSLAKKALELNTSFNRSQDGPDPVMYLTHILRDYLPEHVLKKPKVIYVVRNPKSVAVSYFSHSRRAKPYEYDGSFAGFYPVFMKGMHTIWGNWFEHITEYWEQLKSCQNAHFVFYEELQKEPLKVIRELSTFLGYEHDEAFCREVVRMTSLENMKPVERKRDPEFTKGYWKENQVGFVREGKVGSWKETFPEGLNRAFDEVYEEKMEKYPELKKQIHFD